MNMASHNLMLIILPWFLSTSNSFVGSQTYCNEFISPKELTTRGFGVDYIQYPSRGDVYPRNQYCEWIIKCNPGEVIHLQVQDSNIQAYDVKGGCNMDYVNIYDVNNGVKLFVDRFCGTSAGMSYQSTGTSMRLEFYSDSAYEYKGFRLSYQAQKEGEHDSDDLDLSVQLGVGLSVSVVVTLTLVMFFLVYKYRKRQVLRSQPSGTSLESEESESNQQPQARTSTSSPTSRFVNNGRVSGRGVPAWGHYRQGQQDFSDGRHEGVFFPSDQDQDPYGYGVGGQDVAGGYEEYGTGIDGRSSPPPSYESLGYSEGLMTPPPYEAIVKESEEPRQEAEC